MLISRVASGEKSSSSLAPELTRGSMARWPLEPNGSCVMSDASTRQHVRLLKYKVVPDWTGLPQPRAPPDANGDANGCCDWPNRLLRRGPT